MTLDQLSIRRGDEGLDVFYISFGDLMVILCVFFVMLLSMSKVDIGSFEKVKSVMTGSTEDTSALQAIAVDERVRLLRSDENLGFLEGLEDFSVE